MKLVKFCLTFLHSSVVGKARELAGDITGVERTTDPTTSGSRCAKLDPNECQSPDMRYSRFFHINCAIFFMSIFFMVPENCCPINQLATTHHISWNKAENIEEFMQPASGKPNPDLVLILAYVPKYPTRHSFLLFIPPLAFGLMQSSTAGRLSGEWNIWLN